MKLYDNDEYREEFMSAVYDILVIDWTNDRANQIIDLFDAAPLVEAEQVQPNTQLTLAELREMADKCEGVYVAHIDGSPVFRGLKYCAAVLDFSPAFGSITMHVHAIYGDRLTMWEDDYGKTWLAYRRRPEEGTA